MLVFTQEPSYESDVNEFVLFYDNLFSDIHNVLQLKVVECKPDDNDSRNDDEKQNSDMQLWLSKVIE